MVSLFGSVNPSFKAVNPAPLPLDVAKQVLFQTASTYGDDRNIAKDIVDKVYFAGLNENIDNSDENRKRVGIGYGDRIINCPTINFGRAVFKFSSDTAKVYQMHYKAKMGNLKWLTTKWGGAGHTDDLYPVFGMPFRYPEKYLNREREISNEMINILASFIRTG